jgi:hypothetical protein
VMGSILLYFLAAMWGPLFPGHPTLGPSHSPSHLFSPPHWLMLCEPFVHRSSSPSIFKA